jgi:hypothetical protein
MKKKFNLKKIFTSKTFPPYTSQSLEEALEDLELDYDVKSKYFNNTNSNEK